MMKVWAILVLAAFFGGFWAGGAQAKEQPQCRSNGKCCKELNRFWDRITSRAKPTPGGPEHSVLRGGKDFLMLDSSKYPWDRKLRCPSMQSKIAEGFKILYDFSKTKYATTNYYDFAKNALNDKGYAVTIIKMETHYAEANKMFSAIVLSGSNTGLLTSVTVASQIVHEAAHVKYGAHHVICDHGQVKSKESCDQELGDALSENAGAYTWQAFFLNEYARSNADKGLRKSARSMLKAIIENQINALPKYGPDGVTPLKKYYGIE